MKYTLRNIFYFIKNEKMIFFLVIICIVTSCFIINFSYGLYQNYNIVKKEESSEILEMDILINDNKAISKQKLKDCLFSISDKTNDSVSIYGVFVNGEELFDTLGESNGGWNRVFFTFTVKNNTIHTAAKYKETLEKYGELISGDYFTDQQEVNGSLVAIVRPEGDFEPENDCTKRITTKVENDKRWVEIQNKEYEVIGYHKRSVAPILPFESLDETTMLQDAVLLSFKKSITISQYNDIKTNFEKSFGNAVTVPEMDIPEAENYYLYNTIIIISVFIALLAAINFAVLYKYILSRRVKMLSVFRLCGCTKYKSLWIFLSECMLITIPLFILTTLIYDQIILSKLEKNFEYIRSAHSLKVYMLIFGIYTVSMIIVMILMIGSFLNKTIREAREVR